MELFLSIWLIIGFPLGILLGRFMSRQFPDITRMATSSGDANKLIKEVVTKENEDRVKAVVGYYENRKGHGAEEKENYERLISDLESFREKDND